LERDNRDHWIQNLWSIKALQRSLLDPTFGKQSEAGVLGQEKAFLPIGREFAIHLFHFSVLI
jgi:hypothetical protein